MGETAARALRDRPGDRAGWFLAGRKAPSGPGLAATGNAPPPARNLLRSFQQASLMPHAGLAAAQPWTALGPAPQRSMYWGNVSGRVTSLAVDNQNQNHVLYVGTAFGGLWQTSDYTASSPHFVPLGDASWPSLAVGSVAVGAAAAGKPSILYVGTGEANEAIDSYYGVGLLRSTDGGKNWALSTGAGGFVPLATGAQFNVDGPFVGAAVSRIVVDPVQPQHVLIAVASSPLGQGKRPQLAIYESGNSGDSWQPMALAGGPASGYNTTDLIYEPVQQRFYAAVQDLGIYRLSRGETQWTRLKSPFVDTPVDSTNFDRASLATRASDGQVAVYALISAGFFGTGDARNFALSRPTGQDTGLATSLDGDTWRPVAVPAALLGDQGFYDQWIAAPGQSLVAGGIDIWRSAVPAAAWTNVTAAYDWGGGLAHPEHHVHGDHHAAIVLDELHWIIGSDGGIWRTDDGGANWSNLNTDISSIQFMSVTPIREVGQSYLGGSQDNGTTVGGPGETWGTTLTGDGGFTLGNPGQTGQYFTERFYVSLCRSDDSGKTWNTVVDDDTIDDASPFYVPYQLLRGAKDEIVLGAQRVWLGPAVPSTPGKDWKAISGVLSDNGFVQSIASAASSPGTVYVATTDGRIFVNNNVHAANAAQKWAASNSNQLPSNRVYAALAVDPANPKVAYLGVQGFGSGHVFRTDNRGAGWSDITPTVSMNGQKVQLDSPVNAILVDPAFPAEVYVATDVGVFVSTNRGKDWQPHGVGLPKAAVLDLKMSMDRKIVAATHGRGAWITDALPH